jgi:lysozyme
MENENLVHLISEQSMFTPDFLAILIQSLVLHEGDHEFPYTDTLGNITIGVGYNLTARGLSLEWRNKQLLDDITYFYNQWNDTFPWYKDLNQDRQIVLIDFAFMGWKKVLEFHDMLRALSIHDYHGAADAMMDSRWAKQVKGRATDLHDGMWSGIYKIKP